MMSKFVVAFVMVVACARTRVESVNEEAARGPAPSVVVVFEPEFRAAADADRERDQLGHQIAAAFTTKLVHDLRDKGVAAELATQREVPANAAAVHARFIDVEEGSRLKRLVIGFGAGASRVDTHVKVTRGERLVLEFDTHADSGLAPGGAVTTGAGVVATGGVTAVGVAGAAATGALKAHLSELERMAAKNGGEAAKLVVSDFAKRGWIVR